MASATDDFNRANADPISGNWTTANSSSCALTSNQAQGNVAFGRQDEYWNAATFGNDQYSQIRVRTVSSGTLFVYAIVRLSDSIENQGYYLRTDGATLKIFKQIAGVFTELQDCGVTTTNGDIIKLTIQGNTLRAYKNGAQVGTDQASGGELLSGRTGFAIFETGALDDWEGGDLVIAAGTPFFTTIGAKRI